MFELLESVNAWTAVPIALVGFGLTFRQAKKARTAAEAARAAAETAKDQFRLVSAASLLPQLMRLEGAVDVAARSKSNDMMTHVLESWLWQSSMCRGYLDSARPEEDQVMKKLQKSIAAVSALKLAVANFDDGTDWHQMTEAARKAISGVTQQLGGVAAQQSVRTEGPTDGS